MWSCHARKHRPIFTIQSSRDLLYGLYEIVNRPIVGNGSENKLSNNFSIFEQIFKNLYGYQRFLLSNESF